MKIQSVLITLFAMFSATSAFAMPHDEPELHFFSNKTMSIGLVYSEGVDSGAELVYHRALQEVYVCKNGKLVADFTHFGSVIDADGAYIVGRAKGGKEFGVEISGDSVEIMNSTLVGLSIDPSNSITLPLSQSGVSGFELDWSRKCAPKQTD